MSLDLDALEKVAREAHADWASNVPTMPLRTYHTTFRPETALALIAEVRALRQVVSADGQAIAQATVHTASAIGGLQLSIGEQMVKMGYEGVMAERDALQAKLDETLARISKAWELHEPFTWSFGHGPVQSCKWCADNGVPQEVASWPCPTVRALEALGGEAE